MILLRYYQHTYSTRFRLFLKASPCVQRNASTSEEKSLPGGGGGLLARFWINTDLFGAFGGLVSPPGPFSLFCCLSGSHAALFALAPRLKPPDHRCLLALHDGVAPCASFANHLIQVKIVLLIFIFILVCFWFPTLLLTFCPEQGAPLDF